MKTELQLELEGNDEYGNSLENGEAWENLDCLESEDPDMPDYF